jgi:hypothetical protein
MSRRRTRITLGVAIFLAAALLGVWVGRPLAPARLHAEVETRLSELLGGEVTVGRLRLALHLGLRLEGSEVRVWPASSGPGLEVTRVVADVRPFAHLTGQRRLSSLRLEGARLHATRAADGVWSPPPVAALLAPPGGRAGRPGEPQAPPHPDELLRPLVMLETIARALLQRSLVADSVELRDAEIVLTDAAGDAASPRRLVIGRIQAQLRRRWLTGETRLALRFRVGDGTQERGGFEAEGRHGRDGALRLALAANGYDLAALAPWLRGERPGADLAGRLAGALVFEAPEPGSGRLEVDLVAHDVRSRAGGAAAGPLAAGRVALRGELGITPEEVRVRDLRLRAGDLDLELDGTLERPLAPEATAALALALRDASVADVRHAIGWLPEVRREEAQAILAPIESGQLRLLRTGGTASLSGRQAFLAGRTRELPREFVIDAKLDGARIRIGESDHLDALRGRLWWTGDRLEVRGATAVLDGAPLPRLDLSLEGVSHLFASRPEDRRLASGAPPLPGLRPLWRWLRGGDSGPGERTLTRLRLQIERLEHPVFFWPIEDTVARIVPVAGGVRVRGARGHLAGVPVSIEGEWLFEPEERVRARFVAQPPRARPRRGPAGAGWGRGHFELGAVEGPRWRQRSARGSFALQGAELRVDQAVFELAPDGRLEAAAALDLAGAERVPFRSRFSVVEGDVSSLAAALGLPKELASGRADLAGSLAGTLDPRAPLAGTLSGGIDLEARDGSVRKAIPLVAAVALASDLVNPFARRDEIRFARVASRLDLDAGRLSTSGLTLDGPDLRAFASGAIDLGESERPLDLEIVLFLFRPVDSVLEKIPLVNFLLLGRDQSIMAATIALDGSWEDPRARLVPLRSLTSGPGQFVFEGLSDLVGRGFGALGTLLDGSPAPPTSQPPLPAAPADPLAVQ